MFGSTTLNSVRISYEALISPHETVDKSDVQLIFPSQGPEGVPRVYNAPKIQQLLNVGSACARMTRTNEFPNGVEVAWVSPSFLVHCSWI